MEMDGRKEARYWETAESGKIKCRLCPHNCLISSGNRGLCGVRENEAGALYTLNYGLVSSLALDPIEKKPLNRFFPGSLILSAGSIGCNFTCPFCQNHSIARARPGEVETRYIPPEELAESAGALKASGNIGVAYTYNEPMIWFEYVLDAARAVRKRDMKNVLVTNGYVSGEPLKELLPFIDAMNIDLKAFDPGFYKSVVRGGLAEVMKTIAAAAKACHVEVTTLVIPGLNDAVEDTKKMAQWLANLSPDLPLHLSRFFPRYEMTDRTPTPRHSLNELALAAREFLNYVYIGNV
jgi:pyruvate formate lyase activating enzyme